MLRKLFLGGWYIVVAVLLLLALLIALVRGNPSLYQKFLPEIQENVSVILGKPVQIESMRVDWHGITPLVSIRNLSILDNNEQQSSLLDIEKAEIELDLYRSLIKQKLSVKELTFIGGNLEATRTAAERIIINGIDVSDQLEKRNQTSEFDGIKINLLNSTIAINDEVHELNYFFDRVDIVLGVSKDRFKIISNFTLPDTLGKSLTIVSDIRNLEEGLKNIKGDLYAKGQSINLQLIDDFFPKLRVGIKNGISDFEIWGDFDSSSQKTVVGTINLQDLLYHQAELPALGIEINQEISAIESKFRLRGDTNDWHLVLKDVEVHTSDFTWPGNQYEFQCIACERDQFSVSTALDYMNAQQLLATLQHFPFIAERIAEPLEKVNVHGEMKSFKGLAAFNDKKLTKFSYSALLQDVNVHIPSQGVSLTSLAGKVDGNHLTGQAELATQATKLELDKVLNFPLENHNINGLLKWKTGKDDFSFALQQVEVTCGEMNASVQGMVQIKDNLPYIDIQVEVPEAYAATIMKYLPYKRMKPKLSKWLSEAINGGTLRNGKLLFHGNPKNFPFKNKPGRFQVEAEVYDGVLNYKNDWPIVRDVNANLIINNNYLAVNASQGTILDSKVDRVLAEIHDLKLPKLVINGHADGPANNIFQYLQGASLLPNDSKLVKHLTASGNTGLDLDLIITLTKKLEKELYVGGELEFKNAGLTVNPLSLPFTDLQGKLKFDLNGAQGQGVTGKLYGIPVNASARKLGSGRTEITAFGDLDLDVYLNSNYSQLTKYLTGIAPIEAKINIPRLGKASTDKTLWVEVDSNLAGAKINLPEPFIKDFQESKNLSIHSKIQQGVESEIYASLNNQVYMKSMLGSQTGKLSRMELRFGNEQFILPAHGIKVSGRLNSFQLGEWRNVFKNESKKEISVNEIDLNINKVALGELDIKNVDFYAQGNSQFWSGRINSSVVKGTFEYPKDVKSGSIATADFDYMRFPANKKSANQKSASDLDPRTLPAMVVNAKQFEFKNAVFNNVSLKTKPVSDGISIDSLQGRGNDLTVSASGVWKVSSNDTQATNLKILLNTSNIQNALTGLGFDSAVTGGDGRITADFIWPKAPYQFDLSAVTGNANLRFNDGTISSVDPGAGRFIGLVNLGEITRRMSLDFTDFFSKGFAFEKIRGDLVFENAVLTTNNLKVKGPSADILIQGKTGITAKDYDQLVTVTPHVSGGLPWIGLAVGGPIGAVGVLVGEKIAKTMGIDVNKVTQVQYSLKGSWEDPVIEPVAQKLADDTKPAAQGQPSPSNQAPTPP